MDKYKNISQSAKLDIQYDDLLTKVADKFRVRDADCLNVSESKASRVLNKKQKDLDVLSEMASFVGIEVDIINQTKK